MNTLMMPAAAARFNHVIAFDVANATLSLHILPSGETLCLHNDGAAVRRFLKREQKRNRKQGLGPMLRSARRPAVTRTAVLKAAAELGLDCQLAHGSSVRAYARFRGRHAKNDPIDAALIAEYARDKPDLRLYQPPRLDEAALRALMGRRAELKDMIQAETCRFEHASLKAVRVSLENHLAALKDQLALIEKEIRALTRRDEAFNHQSRLMQTLAGIGAVASQTILAFFPEIGHISSSSGSCSLLAAVPMFAPAATRSSATDFLRRRAGQPYSLRTASHGRRASSHSLRLHALKRTCLR